MNNVFMIEKLKRIAVAKRDEWVILKRSFDIPVEVIEEQMSMDAIICFSATSGDLIRSVIVPADPPTDITTWALECMMSPEAGKPRRPALLTFAGVNLEYSTSEFEQLGIEVDTTDIVPPIIDEIIEEMKAQMGSSDLPIYTDVIDEKDAACIEAFFVYAAEFYKQKPWKCYEYDIPLKLDVTYGGDNQVPLWVDIFGADDDIYGMTIFRSYEDYSTFTGTEDPEEMIEMLANTWSMSLTYIDVKDIDDRLKAEYEEHGWTIANKSAYPSMVITDPESEDVYRRPVYLEFDIANLVLGALTQQFKLYKKEIKKQLKSDMGNILKSGLKMSKPNVDVSVMLYVPAPEYITETYEYDPFGDDSDED